MVLILTLVLMVLLLMLGIMLLLLILALDLTTIVSDIGFDPTEELVGPIGHVADVVHAVVFHFRITSEQIPTESSYAFIDSVVDDILNIVGPIVNQLHLNIFGDEPTNLSKRFTAPSISRSHVVAEHTRCIVCGLGSDFI